MLSCFTAGTRSSRVIAWGVALLFFLSSYAFYLQAAPGQTVISPNATRLLPSSATRSYPVLRGLRFNPDNPLRVEFIVDMARESVLDKAAVSRLVKYFLAGLTIPEDDLWVNLSPYEQESIIPDALGRTDLGKDLLNEDYILKQLAASLTYPESEAGKKYWNILQGASRARDAAIADNGNGQAAIASSGASLPPRDSANGVSAFQKVWIVPDQAVVYAHQGCAYINQATLKVMTEEDYVAQQNNIVGAGLASARLSRADARPAPTNVFRQHILPLIAKEVNTGEHFAQLRQIYASLVLAVWFKQRFCSRGGEARSAYDFYVNGKKIVGIDNHDPQAKARIFEQYVDNFKNGSYDYIRRQREGVGARISRRRYFSGGCEMRISPCLVTTQHCDSLPPDLATQIAQVEFRSAQDNPASPPWMPPPQNHGQGDVRIDPSLVRRVELPPAQATLLVAFPGTMSLGENLLFPSSESRYYLPILTQMARDGELDYADPADKLVIDQVLEANPSCALLDALLATGQMSYGQAATRRVLARMVEAARSSHVLAQVGDAVKMLAALCDRDPALLRELEPSLKRLLDAAVTFAGDDLDVFAIIRPLIASAHFNYSAGPYRRLVDNFLAACEGARWDDVMLAGARTYWYLVKHGYVEYAAVQKELSGFLSRIASVSTQYVELLEEMRGDTVVRIGDAERLRLLTASEGKRAPVALVINAISHGELDYRRDADRRALLKMMFTQYAVERLRTVAAMVKAGQLDCKNDDDQRFIERWQLHDPDAVIWAALIASRQIDFEGDLARIGVALAACRGAYGRINLLGALVESGQLHYALESERKFIDAEIKRILDMPLGLKAVLRFIDRLVAGGHLSADNVRETAPLRAMVAQACRTGGDIDEITPNLARLIRIGWFDYAHRADDRALMRDITARAIDRSQTGPLIAIATALVERDQLDYTDTRDSRLLNLATDIITGGEGKALLIANLLASARRQAVAGRPQLQQALRQAREVWSVMAASSGYMAARALAYNIVVLQRADPALAEQLLWPANQQRLDRFVETSEGFLNQNMEILKGCRADSLAGTLDSALDYFDDCGISIYVPEIYDYYRHGDTRAQRRERGQTMYRYYRAIASESKLPDIYVSPSGQRALRQCAELRRSVRAVKQDRVQRVVKNTTLIAAAVASGLAFGYYFLFPSDNTTTHGLTAHGSAPTVTYAQSEEVKKDLIAIDKGADPHMLLAKLEAQHVDVTKLMISLLDSSDPEVLRGIATVLSVDKENYPSTRAMLLKAINGDNLDMKTGATYVLGRGGYCVNSDLPLMLSLTHHPDWRVRENAMYGLKGLPALSRLQVEALLAGVNDPVPMVRAGAIIGLYEVWRQIMAPGHYAQLVDAHDLLPEIVREVDAAGHSSDRYLRSGLAVAVGQLRGEGSMRDQDTARLLELSRDADDFTRQSLAVGLRYAKAGALAHNDEIYDRLLELYASPDAGTRAIVAEVWEKAFTPDSEAMIEALWRGIASPVVAVRAQAMRLLGALDVDDERIVQAAEKMAREPEAAIRAAAAFTLAHLAPERSAALLAEAAQAPEAEVRAAVATGLGLAARLLPEQYDLLAHDLGDQDNKVVQSAVEALTKIANDANRRILAERVAAAVGEAPRKVTLEMLKKLDPQRRYAPAALAQVARFGKVSAHRADAVLALGEFDMDRSMATILAIAAETPALRVAAVYALDHMDDLSWRAQAFLEQAHHDASMRVRVAALTVDPNPARLLSALAPDAAREARNAALELLAKKVLKLGRDDFAKIQRAICAIVAATTVSTADTGTKALLALNKLGYLDRAMVEDILAMLRKMTQAHYDNNLLEAAASLALEQARGDDPEGVRVLLDGVKGSDPKVRAACGQAFPHIIRNYGEKPLAGLSTLDAMMVERASDFAANVGLDRDIPVIYGNNRFLTVTSDFLRAGRYSVARSISNLLGDVRLPVIDTRVEALAPFFVKIRRQWAPLPAMGSRGSFHLVVNNEDVRHPQDKVAAMERQLDLSDPYQGRSQRVQLLKGGGAKAELFDPDGGQLTHCPYNPARNLWWIDMHGNAWSVELDKDVNIMADELSDGLVARAENLTGEHRGKLDDMVVVFDACGSGDYAIKVRGRLVEAKKAGKVTTLPPLVAVANRGTLGYINKLFDALQKALEMRKAQGGIVWDDFFRAEDMILHFSDVVFYFPLDDPQTKELAGILGAHAQEDGYYLMVSGKDLQLLPMLLATDAIGREANGKITSDAAGAPVLAVTETSTNSSLGEVLLNARGLAQTATDIKAIDALVERGGFQGNAGLDRFLTGLDRELGGLRHYTYGDIDTEGVPVDLHDLFGVSQDDAAALYDGLAFNEEVDLATLSWGHERWHTAMRRGLLSFSVEGNVLVVRGRSGEPVARLSMDYADIRALAQRAATLARSDSQDDIDQSRHYFLRAFQRIVWGNLDRRLSQAIRQLRGLPVQPEDIEIMPSLHASITETVPKAYGGIAMTGKQFHVETMGDQGVARSMKIKPAVSNDDGLVDNVLGLRPLSRRELTAILGINP